ncbi:alternative ribosome rescue aminoacyl-tRNA hydrolase ArfB [Cyanobium gracile]|uniref:Protein chain release factor B n=1 Tax=Cyanobium gracile (strain ATCC 27147 / PCC 6307) TaxID=292564 RepID=K9P880_CYAGP|nr:alternative ribosome rescue aminoacyl-tRNA hydrolase ArfB [Cyanobium gracile]AFY29622.1 protein chain release factor B [Cyanobium gracile PCC 6307]
MSGDLPLGNGRVIPAAELGWRFSRASGPGGQGVNTTDSRVELVYDLAASDALPPALRQRALRRLAARLTPAGVVVVAAEHRSQWQNRQAAQKRLVELIQAAIAPPPAPRRPTKPSRGSVERRLKAKRQRGSLKSRRRQGPPEET